jgi:hypothetical protein
MKQQFLLNRMDESMVMLAYLLRIPLSEARHRMLRSINCIVTNYWVEFNVPFPVGWSQSSFARQVLYIKAKDSNELDGMARHKKMEQEDDVVQRFAIGESFNFSTCPSSLLPLFWAYDLLQRC